MSVPLGLFTLAKTFKLGSQALCCQFSSDGTHVAFGCADGTIQIRSSRGAYELIQTLKSDDVTKDSVTSLKYRPYIKADTFQNLLLATYASGIVKQWHTTSGKCLASFPVGTEALTAMDYASDGSKFAVGGGDFVLRVYDAQKLAETSTLGAGVVRSFSVGQVAPDGHTNRVFGIKFHPTDTNILVSGGWDKTIQVWDLREPRPVRYLYGPFVAGDTLDFDESRNALLVGTHTETKSLQIYDFPSMKLTNTIDPGFGTHVYSCQFLRKEPGLVLCAGSNANEVRIVAEKNSEVVASHASASAFYATSANRENSIVAACGEDKTATLLHVQSRSGLAVPSTESSSRRQMGSESLSPGMARKHGSEASLSPSFSRKAK